MIDPWRLTCPLSWKGFIISLGRYSLFSFLKLLTSNLLLVSGMIGGFIDKMFSQSKPDFQHFVI